MPHGDRHHLKDLEIALIRKHHFLPQFSCPMCMFFWKGKTLFFHSFINQRLFSCFTTRQIQIFLKAMLDYLDFYLLQQLWVEIWQLQGCQMRVLLEFSFHDGVSQSRYLSSPSSTKLMLGNSLIWKLFGCYQEPHDGYFPSSTPFTYDFYQHFCLPPCKNKSFFFITSLLSRHIE